MRLWFSVTKWSAVACVQPPPFFPFSEGRGPLCSFLAAEFLSPFRESNSSTKNHTRPKLTLREVESVSRYRRPLRRCMTWNTEVCERWISLYFTFLSKINKGDWLLMYFLCFLVWIHWFSRLFGSIVWSLSPHFVLWMEWQGSPRAIMQIGQRGNFRASAGICEFH